MSAITDAINKLNLGAEIREGEFTGSKGDKLTSLIVRHGGEALRIILKDDKIKGVKFTSHYFVKNGEKRDWVNPLEGVMKTEMREIYDTLKCNFSVPEKPVTIDDIIKRKVERFKEVFDANVPDYYVVDDRSIKDRRITLVNTKDYAEMSLLIDDKGEIGAYANVGKDPNLVRFAHNAYLMFKNVETNVEYVNKETGEVKKKTFLNKEEAELFMERLPKNRYDAHFSHDEISWEIEMDEPVNDYEMAE
jgi:hypothetical protein